MEHRQESTTEGGARDFLRAGRFGHRAWPIGWVEHLNQERCPGQLIYLVGIDQYMYLVPFVRMRVATRFLKTIIPSRKATRDYRRKQDG